MPLPQKDTNRVLRPLQRGHLGSRHDHAGMLFSEESLGFLQLRHFLGEEQRNTICNIRVEEKVFLGADEYD